MLPQSVSCTPDTITTGQVRMKHNTCPFACRPAYRFGVAETFVTNGNAEFYAVHFKNTALGSGYPGGVFSWVKLVFGLVTQYFAGGGYYLGDVQKTCRPHTNPSA
jgi:hypothetical protein